MEYAIYLRKSRADMEAEALGEGETLARHRKALTALADRQGYHVAHIYEELVSGDTIAARPQMQTLLSEVEHGRYAGVIVNDIDRLARGDSIDQAVIRETFKESNTKIITPSKTYDFSINSDEDFVDFSLFMARFEYKQIKRRMQMGKDRAAAEGSWQGCTRPFGYQVVRRTDKKGMTLTPDPHEAEIVRLIYDWYVSGMGKGQIRNQLDDMGERTAGGNRWSESSIYYILRNQLYIGDYMYNRYKYTTKYSDDEKHTKRTDNSKQSVVPGAFPAIVDREVFDKVQSILSSHAIPSSKAKYHLTNPLAGLVKCSICGKTMRCHVVHGTQYLICNTHGCKTSGMLLRDVEIGILDGLDGWVDKYTSKGKRPSKTAPTASQRERDIIMKQLDTIDLQMGRLHDLLEQGLYTPQVFVQRRDELTEKSKQLQNRLHEIDTTPTTEEAVTALLPKIYDALDVYDSLTNPLEKNLLLKSILARVDYSKTVAGKVKNPAQYMTLTLYPKIVPSCTK